MRGAVLNHYILPLPLSHPLSRMLRRVVRHLSLQQTRVFLGLPVVCVSWLLMSSTQLTECLAFLVVVSGTVFAFVPCETLLVQVDSLRGR